MITTISKFLKEKGITPSVQRIEIMRFMLTHKTHPTVDDIYRELSKSIPTLSKTTIYNTLTLLCDKGAVISFTTDDNTTHYDGVVEEHAHFKCKNCGQIFDVPMPMINNSEPQGFDIQNVEVTYYGICPKCTEYQ